MVYTRGKNGIDNLQDDNSRTRNLVLFYVVDYEKTEAPKPRPIKIMVKNTDVAYQILRKAKLLKDAVEYKSVHISPDRIGTVDT